MAIITYTKNCSNCNNYFYTADTKQKFCNLSCSTSNKNKNNKQTNILNYFNNPKKCINCYIFLDYKKRKNKFCGNSCSAKFNNLKRNYEIIKTGPKKGFKSTNILTKKPSFTKIKPCCLCKKYHAKLGKTCSTICHKKLLSNLVKERINNGWNPNFNRGRHKKSFLEISFQDWLDINYPNVNYICEHPFKNLQNGKTFFADFYFPYLKLIIELDGTQHTKTKFQDAIRDEYIFLTYNIRTLRITHSEYQAKSKIELVKNLLEPGSGVKPDTSDWKSDM